ncbi:MAG: hypothetical protein U0790_04815, partial [Isosphaeraceae bacterium]
MPCRPGPGIPARYRVKTRNRRFLLSGHLTTHLSDLRGQLAHVEAVVEAEFSSAEKALEYLRRSRSQARLLLVELGEDTVDIDVERLCTYFAGWPILALVSERATLADVQRAYRAGARQVVNFPIDLGVTRLPLRCKSPVEASLLPLD